MDGNYASSAFHNINNFDADRMPDYWLGNASLTWVSADEQSYGYPRMYGARVRYNHF